MLQYLQIINTFIAEYFWQIFFVILNVLFAYYVFAKQHKLVFYPIKLEKFPTVEDIKRDFEIDLDFREIPITTYDKETIYMYTFLQENPKEHNTILLFQSNAGTMLDRIAFAKKYCYESNVNFIIAVYRGFDKSTGVPVESKMSKDIERYYSTLETLDIDMNKLIVLGRSIGVGMALKFYNQFDCKALIVENGFTQLIDMAKQLFPIAQNLPDFLLKVLIRDKWNNINEMMKMKQGKHILFFSSGQDEMIPMWMMRKLYDISIDTGKVSKMEFFPDGHHMDLPMHDTYFRRLNTYLDSLDNDNDNEN